MTGLQVELAQAEVEADRALQRRPDPVLVEIASAGREPCVSRLAG